MMITIPDTPNDEPLSKECAHLEPIVKLLEENGNRIDRDTGLLTDKGCGSFMVFFNKLDTELIKNEVLLSEFIRIEKDTSVFCARCWFTLDQRIKHKVYMGPRQIEW